MSRMRRFFRLLAPVLVGLCGCLDAPGWKNFPKPTTGASSTGESSTGTADPGEFESTAIMTSIFGSTSGSSTTTSTTEGTGGTSTGSTGTTTATTGAPGVCGDGVVDPGEECDDGNANDEDGCPATCLRDRRVFASAALHDTGDLGGIEGADSLCRQYGLQSGNFDDTWMTLVAWLSDADHDVRDRLHPGKGRYVRMDGEVVVETGDDFYAGMLAAPINVDEHGQPVFGSAVTGTRPDGTAAPGTHCNNWTSGSPGDKSAWSGSTKATGPRWTLDDIPDAVPHGCILGGERLYCIEGE